MKNAANIFRKIKGLFAYLRSRTVSFFAVATPAIYALIDAARAETETIRNYLPEDWSKYLLGAVVIGGIWLRAKTTAPLKDRAAGDK